MEQNKCSFSESFPPQHQKCQPGLEYMMTTRPVSERDIPLCRLDGKAALIIVGDSGIGRAVAYDFTKNGSDVAVVDYNEDRDADETANRLEELGCKPLLLHGNLKNQNFARECVCRTVETFGRLDILVNNHAVQFIKRSILDIPQNQLRFVFENNVFSFFHLIQVALLHMKTGGRKHNQHNLRYGIPREQGHDRLQLYKRRNCGSDPIPCTFAG